MALRVTDKHHEMQRVVGPFVCAKCASDIESTWRRKSLYRRTYIRLRVPRLSQEECLRLEGKLNAYLRECGCSLGAKCMLGGVAASIGWQNALLAWGPPYWPGFLMRSVVAALLFGAIGKTAGIAWAKMGMMRIVDRVRGIEEDFLAG
jgi:hypothetical protein